MKTSCVSDPAALVAEELYTGRLFDISGALAATPKLTKEEWRRALAIVVELRAAEAAERAASSAHFDLDHVLSRKPVPDESLLRRIRDVLGRMPCRPGT